MTNPIIGLLRTFFMFLTRMFQFDKTIINKKIKMSDGCEFTIFRRVMVVTRNQNPPGAYFLVRFKPKDLSPEENIEFSNKPMMIFMGFKGFRTKYWAVDYKTGLCQGLYEWQTVEDAKNYSQSVAMKFMAKRSEPETVMFKIVDKTKEELKYEIY